MSESILSTPIRILVVEDQDDLRENLSEFLRMENFHVNVASTGREAIELMEDAKPDIVLSDISMPDGDGLWLIHEFKKHPEYCHIPVIFLTAWADRENNRKCMDLGAASYITKPFQIEEILGAIRSQLAKIHSAEKE
jgi:DNA-binding response OmpR family regulator